MPISCHFRNCKVLLVTSLDSCKKHCNKHQVLDLYLFLLMETEGTRQRTSEGDLVGLCQWGYVELCTFREEPDSADVLLRNFHSLTHTPTESLETEGQGRKLASPGRVWITAIKNKCLCVSAWAKPMKEWQNHGHIVLDAIILTVQLRSFSAFHFAHYFYDWYNSLFAAIVFTAHIMLLISDNSTLHVGQVVICDKFIIR